MRAIFVMLTSVASLSGVAQVPQSASPVTSALQMSISSMLGSVTIQDVTLSGSAEAIAGSDDETGQFVFTSTMTGSSQTNLNLQSRKRTEYRVQSTSGPTGSWSSNDGVLHAISQHNLFTESAWPFPAIVLKRLLGQSSSWMVAYAGLDGSLMHFVATQPPPKGVSGPTASLPQHLSEMGIYLDSTSFLPTKLTFNDHPDNNAAFDIPVMIQFSDYQIMNGVLTPAHIQKFVNRTLVLDLHIQSVSLNSGAVISDPSAH